MQLISIIIPIITVIMGIIILAVWPPDQTRSFSENLARKRTSLIVFAGCFIPITIVYYYYLWWLGQQLGAVWIFSLVLAISFAAQIILTVVPVRGTSSKDLHTRASFAVVGAMLLLPLILSFEAESFVDIAFWLPVLYFVVNGGLFSLYLLRRKLKFVRANFLFMQMSFFVVFWLFIILETYLVLV